MAPSIKKEVLQTEAALGPSVDDDFYMATFKGGKVQKVINMTGGLPRRVRRVLDFDSKAEIAKEVALARKRQELDLESGLEFEVPTGENEKTLAEFLLEMKKRKSAGSLATVQRKKLTPAKKAKSVKKAVPVKHVSPVKEVVSMEEVFSIREVVFTAEVPVDIETHTKKVVSMEETIPVEEVVPVEASPPRKKRKRRSTSVLHTSSKLLDPSEPQGDDETLAEFLKKSASTTGRASSDNAGIKVFQRRKVKFKAVRRRTSKIGDKSTSSILVCDDLCECEACGPLRPAAANIVQSPTPGSRVNTVVSVLTNCSTSTTADDVPDDGSLETLSTKEADHLSHPDLCMGDFDTLTLPDDIHQLPVLHCSPHVDDSDDIQELTEEQFRVEVAQQAPSSCEVAALGSGFSCSGLPVLHCAENSHVGEYDECLGAPSDGPELCDSDMPKVLGVESRPQPPEESSGGEGEVSREPCAFNTESSNFSFANNTHAASENSASLVTPMELDLAVERIESMLETLVTPDDLLPTHLSASKSTRKKKKRRRFSESLSLGTVIKEGSYLGEVPVDNLRNPPRREGDLAELTSLDALMGVTENVPSSVSNITEEVALFATSESSVLLGQQISGQISEQISELISQEPGPAPEPTLSLLSEAKDTPAACLTDVELVLPSSHGDTVVNADVSGSNSLVRLSDAADVGGTPTEPNSSDDDPGICQTASTGLDAAERAEDVGGTSTSKALFSSLKTNGFSNRNRKSFSPKSQTAFLKACRPERSIPTFKIKLMKSNLSDRSSSMLFTEGMVQENPSQLQDPTPVDSSGQDMLQCDMEQVQLVASPDLRPPNPPQTSDDTPNMSAIPPSGPPSDCNTHIVPGSPEYKKEHYVSCQRVSDLVSIECTPDNSVSNMPCTEGSLHINVECHPEPPTDPKTTNEKIEPISQQPKSILKTRSDTCRGTCECPRCVSTGDLSRTARNFIRSQMRLADVVAGKLLDEVRNMRHLLEDASPSRAEGESSTSASNIPSEEAKVALDSATKMEDWAKKEILKMSRDSKRVCRLLEVGPRRTIFADDAGHRLCHVRHLPAKKTLSKEFLLPAKDL